MSDTRFSVAWTIGKGTALKMPSGFAALFSDGGAEIPLLFEDETGLKFSVIYDRTRNEIPIRSLIEWIRNHQPQSSDTLWFDCLNIHPHHFRVSLARGVPQSPPKGLYLGKQKDLLYRFETAHSFYLALQDLVTHVFICGVTGTGKTVMGKAILESAIMQRIPAVIVDLKGDLSSLPLVFPSLEPTAFEEWIPVRHDQDRKEQARQESENFREKIELFGMTPDDLARYQEMASFAVFTPKAGKGIPLAIASPLAAPSDIQTLMYTEPATVLEMADSFSATFVKTLFPDQKPSRLKKYISYLQELVRFCWEQNTSLRGREGLETIQTLILQPPLQKIGGMALDDFIPDKARKELASHVAMCLSGAGQLWFQGVPLDIELLLSRPDSTRVPVSIINLRELTTFDDQMHAVSHLAYALFHWARRQGDSGGLPRLLFFIDEIGGGGGRNAFFPSHPYDPPSKPGLNLLLRQGRTFGLSCLFATQNPGDVDYKGLSNCQTWMVSRLQTKRDRDKIIQGMSAAELAINSADDILKEIQPGEFLIKPRTGETCVVRERWLMSYHKTLTESEIARINSHEIRAWFDSYRKSEM